MHTAGHHRLRLQACANDLIQTLSMSLWSCPDLAYESAIIYSGKQG